MQHFLWIMCVCLFCSNVSQAVEATFPWYEHIRSHTAGLISAESTIKIRFMHDVVSEKELTNDFTQLLQVKPNVDGHAVFMNRRELHFTPSQPLKSGQKYLISLDVSKLQNFSQQQSDYRFRIQAIEQNFSIQLDGLKRTDKNIFQLSGVLQTADMAEQKPVEALLQASIGDNKLPIQWHHMPGNRKHRFMVGGIHRGSQAKILILQWSGESIGAKQQGNKHIDIPPFETFDLLKVQVIQDKQRYLSILFSEDLDPAQDLKGLIQLNQHDYDMRVQGNQIKVYHPLKGEVHVLIHSGLKNSHGMTLGKDKKTVVHIEGAKPHVRFVGRGVLLPKSRVLSIPFEAINVHSVQVTAFRIHSDQIGSFLQENNLSGQQSLHRLGRFLWRKTVQLDDVKEETWQHFSLDATTLLKKYPNDLFRLTLSINRSNIVYQCSDADQVIPVVKEIPLQNAIDARTSEVSVWDTSEAYVGLNDDQAWQHRHDPCKDAYYQNNSATKSERNFLASNIGLVAKSADNHEMYVATTHLSTAKAMPRVNLSFYNFQNERIGRVQSDVYGFAHKTLAQTPFYVVAQKGKQKGYLKLAKSSALATSHFDVRGEQVNHGVKGHIYAERGVWRPGDEMFMTFVLLDKRKHLPKDHPVSMRLYNPRGQLVQTVVNHQPVGHFYSFTLKTADNALTGHWRVEAHLGGLTFSKKIRIETVRPNRLKMNLDFGTDTLHRSQNMLKAELSSQWLHGASAAGLKTDVEVSLTASSTHFKRYEPYIFDDPTRSFSSQSKAWFKGQLDDNGKVVMKKPLPDVTHAAGMLTATFKSRVFEKGGAFSVDYLSLPYHPYEHYVGVKLPKGDDARGMLLTDQAQPIQIVSVDANGDPVSLKNVQVTVYKIHWKWWWDKSGDNLAQYASSSYPEHVLQSMVKTNDGLGETQFEIKSPEWGRYLVRVCDLDGGHCTGKVVYVDWPGWAGRAQEGKGSAATRLALSSDQDEYQVGDTAVIHLPNATQGRALLSIENSHQVLQQRWVKLSGKRQEIKLRITDNMVPNVYVNMSLIQPHHHKNNDLPIRLYGILPIHVVSPQTLLTPELDVADEVRPERLMHVGVREQQGRAMTYTLAIVDEGLLGLTRFKTPNLHQAFYKKEALGVLTWDIFDDVVGAYGGKLERLLALGGGDAAKRMNIENKKKRFPPVVTFLGPFLLKKGEQAWHDVMLPQYMGAVRVMVVAGSERAFGHVEKTVVVRDPLGMLVTMPRVLSPDEMVTVPVSLFAMRDEIHDVQLQVKVDHHMRVVGKKVQTIHFDKPGEEMGFITLQVNDLVGKTTLHFHAKSGHYHADTTLNLDVRSPNPTTQHRYQQKISAGKPWSTQIVPHGLAGTNQVSLEISMLPPMNLSGRLQALMTYPHGCVEQTVSSVFPQVFLPELVSVDDEYIADMEENVKAAIKRLQRFQRPDGGFSYWPNGTKSHGWATSYVGHFLLYAKKKGYHVAPGMLHAWQVYQKKVANMWVNHQPSMLNQAYRLYTLALAEHPELGAMNRLREDKRLPSIARWQLASAYRLSGLSEVADDVTLADDLKIRTGSSTNTTFFSQQRDQALLLYALALKGDERSEKMAQDVAQILSSDRWLSTQEIALSLLALTTYGSNHDDLGHFRFEQIVGIESEMVQPQHAVYLSSLEDFPDKGDSVSILNQSNQPLYATVVVDGVPQAGKEKASSQGLSMRLRYEDGAGNILDVRQLKQGQDIWATVVVRNRSNRDVMHLALSHRLPSGWEIGSMKTKQVDLEYQQVRDNRVDYYFSLKRGQEKTLQMILNASYLGRYYLPSVVVEDMYNASTYARTAGKWIEIKR